MNISKEAANFVRNEAAYLRRRNTHAAQGFSDIVRRAKAVLRAFDEAGNSMHGLQIDGGLTLVVDAYLFDYIRDEGVVNIIAVRHGRMLQLMPKVDDEIDEDITLDDPSDASSSKFKLSTLLRESYMWLPPVRTV